MNKNSKKASTVITSLVVIIILIIAYFLIPNSFWNSVGSKNFKSPSHTGTISKDGGPTPTSLRFNSPFKYDNYTPSKKDEFLKKREENSKKSSGGSLYWK